MAADTTHVFLNPTAGRGRTGRRQTRILELLQQRSLPIELHTSRSRGDLENQVRSTVDDGANRIVVAGGDGSIHEATNGILRSTNTASLGVIPSGTGNDFAKACDISLNWEHATTLLADRIATNETPRRIDVGRVNDRYFANGAGIGFDAKVTHMAQSIRFPLGDIVYLLAIFKTMIDGIASPAVSIEANDCSWNGPLTLAAIANGPSIGGMFQIAPMAKNTDGVLELLVAKPVTRRRILSLLPKLMNGSHIDESDIVHKTVTALRIRSDTPLLAHLDGEIQEPQTDFDISVLSGALHLL